MEQSIPTKILIVDDHSENLVSLEAVLAAPGLDILKALSGEEALHYLLTEEVAVILLDIRMPHMDGFETAEMIRERKKTAHVPIIFLTAVEADKAAVFSGYRAGAVDYIVKPFEPIILKAKVAVFVDLFRRRQELAYSQKRLSETYEQLKIHANLLQDANERLAAEVELHKKARQEITLLHAELERRSHDAIEELNEDLSMQNARLEAAIKELEAFVYSVSHDLQQPLRSIATFSQLALKNSQNRPGERNNDYLARVVSNAEKMAKIVAALLHLSHISRRTITPINVDLQEMASEIVADLRDAEPQRRVDVEIEPGLTAVADSELAKILMTNLIGNAWKFTAVRETARIEIGSRNQDGRTVFFVRDNGIGFNQAYDKSMFKPFHRLHADDSFPGMGIGLSIAQRIVQRHDGMIWAEGECDKGATICFFLPSPPEFATPGNY